MPPFSTISTSLCPGRSSTSLTAIILWKIPVWKTCVSLSVPTEPTLKTTETTVCSFAELKMDGPMGRRSSILSRVDSLQIQRETSPSTIPEILNQTPLFHGYDGITLLPDITSTTTYLK